MTREQFFAHLQYKHAPLVLANAEYLQHLRKYLQNHVLQQSGETTRPSYGTSHERDSVIELWYDNIESLTRANSGPSYLATVRPDETAFNNIDDLIVLFTREIPVFFADDRRGSFKLFEFIHKRADVDQNDFELRLQQYANVLTSDASYRAAITRRVHNLVIAGDETAIAPTADYDAVLETWFETPDAYKRIAASAALSGARTFVDFERSFYVLANEVTILDPDAQKR